MELLVYRQDILECLSGNRKHLGRDIISIQPEVVTFKRRQLDLEQFVARYVLRVRNKMGNSARLLGSASALPSV